jgi:hypothetical protein
LHILALGAAGCARGAAIDSGGGHGEDELAITGGVAGEHGLPAGIFFLCGRWERHRLYFLCEYGIGCHNKERVRRLVEMGYPNLAGKRSSLT